MRPASLESVIGALDGSHIPIKSTARDQDAYINGNGFHSVLLQAVCNHNMYLQIALLYIQEVQMMPEY